MRKLHISPDLALPAEAVTSTFVVYGGKGMGKTNFGSVFAEELSRSRLRYAVIDPMGVWWGLRHSADGASPGIELLILGGVKGDMPIEPTGGAVVADLVADESVNVLIDISRHANGKMWSIGERIRFVRDYFVRLYARQGEKRQPLMQILDEAARFCPQMVRANEPDVAQCLGAVAVMVEEGRNVGVGVCLLTQRSARLNKDVAELADCMIAFRIVGPRSIDAVMDWFGEHIAKEQWKDLIAILRKLPIGRALVVSPGWLEFEGEAQIRRRETFDSSATPKPGEKVKTPRGAAAKPDLGKYQERMAETIERAEANDPAKLKKKIADLQRGGGDVAALQARIEKPKQTIRATEVAKAQRALEAAMKFIVEITTRNFDASLPEADVRKAIDDAVSQALNRVESLMQGRLRDFEKFKVEAGRLLKQMKLIIDSDVVAKVEVRHNEPFTTISRPQEVARAVGGRRTAAPAGGDSNVNLGTGERRCAIAIAQHQPNGCAREQLTTLTGFKRSTRNTYLQRLLSASLVMQSGERFIITQEGLDWIGADYEPLPTGTALQNYWLNKLPDGEGKILRVVLNEPAGISRDEISEHTNFKRSTRNTYIQRLAARELVKVSGETVHPSESLFD
ncbi:MAG: hypothetical protein V7609_2120 [Verrucomicrobiota bacterium]